MPSDWRDRSWSDDEEEYGDPFEYREPAPVEGSNPDPFAYVEPRGGYSYSYSNSSDSGYGAQNTVPMASRYASAYGARAAQPQPSKKRGSGCLAAFGVVLLLAGLATIGVAAYLFFSAQAEYEVGIDEYSAIEQDAVISDEVTGSVTVDFGSLLAQNAEIVGWVRIPDTVVSYPVAQHSDNDWYLEHTFLGQYNLAGSVFMDYRSNADLSDRVTVLYGHHLKNGTMFAAVADYSDQATFDGLREVQYVSADGVLHTLKPLCTMVVSGYDPNVLKFVFADDADFQSYVESVITRSVACSADATAVGVNHLYILSTCSYATDNERTMLVCVEVGGSSWTAEDLSFIQAEADEAAIEG